MGRTLLDKIWDAHTVRVEDGGRCVLYIDRQYIHEVTSPVAFAGLARRGVGVVHPDRITATVDHNIPTVDQHLPIAEPQSRHQVETLRANCARYGIEHFGMGDPRQGIVHIIGPELGLTQPGMTIVCGDSHTSTHGALGAVAFGVGTSEVEMVLASQCILQGKPRAMRITVEGTLPSGTAAKDIILHIIARITASGGTDHFIEFAGEAIRSLSMEGRMTVCNMSIECGARGGMIAPDQTTFDYVKGRKHAPQGTDFDKASAHKSFPLCSVRRDVDRTRLRGKHHGLMPCKNGTRSADGGNVQSFHFAAVKGLFGRDDLKKKLIQFSCPPFLAVRNPRASSSPSPLPRRCRRR